MALPSSGSLSLKGAAGAGRSISQEVDGNETGSKSLTTLSVSAGKSAPHSMLEFYGYSSVPPCSGPPNMVTSASASVVSDDATITWTPDTLGEDATQFTVERAAQSSPGSWTLVGTIAGTSLSDNNLPSDRYTYRVTAQNACGDSASRTTNSVIVP